MYEKDGVWDQLSQQYLSNYTVSVENRFVVLAEG